MGYHSIEDMDFFKDLEELCEEVWNNVAYWPWFAKQTVGRQLVSALDSSDVNMAEGEGR